ncbi:putative DEAD-box ATP-dependent RNA helicase 52 [Paratrimastix pyriformis]|uniref:RNA helicase n=1 Tax=Paratrimastix pyriformis TaxID=342808 RepID=A0ABQ8UI66_9EUKA|nr:putative DEAD-box ATP-dependent RNA helicase 52 [Paratrimastix pyriformis]
MDQAEFDRVSRSYAGPLSSLLTMLPELDVRQAVGALMATRGDANRAAEELLTSHAPTPAPPAPGGTGGGVTSTAGALANAPTGLSVGRAVSSSFLSRRFLARSGHSAGGFSHGSDMRSSFRNVIPPRDPNEEARLFGGDCQSAGINFDKYDGIPVEVSGEEPPDPFQSFTEVDLGESLNRNIQLAHYNKPTPIQKHAIPIVLSGRDLMACAQTGSGKTAAFLFPVICALDKAGLGRGSHGLERAGYKVRLYPSALILAPTRELAIQIFDEATKFSYHTGLKVAVVYGGTKVNEQMMSLRRNGVDLMVATPGRLHDLLERDYVSVSQVRYLILDEADRMLDMGFEPQIRAIVQESQMPPPTVRRTMMFSATFPHEIQRLASEFLLNYLFVVVGSVGTTTDDITQRVVYVADEEDRKRQLLDLLRANTDGLSLVFVETKRDADYIETFLNRDGISVTSIHGDRSQREREDALFSFRHGETPVLVATDVAARGLDIPNVKHVINFNMPNDLERYIHRIGRTGRVGNPGLATAMVNERDKGILEELLRFLSEHNQEVPDWFEQLVYQSSQFRPSRPRRGGAGGPRFAFTARDHRQSQGPKWTSQSYTHSWRDREHTPATPALDRFGARPPPSPVQYVSPATEWQQDDQSRFLRGGSNVGGAPGAGFAGGYAASPAALPPPQDWSSTRASNWADF